MKLNVLLNEYQLLFVNWNHLNSSKRVLLQTKLLFLIQIDGLQYLYLNVKELIKIYNNSFACTSIDFFIFSKQRVQSSYCSQAKMLWTMGRM